MVPQKILDYLEENAVEVEWVEHDRAVSALNLARSLNLRGQELAKPVIVVADDVFTICVLPANRTLDLVLLEEALGADSVRLAEEEEFADLFGDAELGAEPPFGKLYGMPVVLDSTLSEQETIVFRAGSHVDAVALPMEEYLDLEEPQIDMLYWQQRPGNPIARRPIGEMTQQP